MQKGTFRLYYRGPERIRVYKISVVQEALYTEGHHPRRSYAFDDHYGNASRGILY